jgi:nucleotide-binding universal stress UspA family protein
MAEAALPAAVFLAEKLQAHITLMHVIEKDAPEKVHGQSHLKHPQEAERYLNELSKRFSSTGIQFDCHVHTTEVDDVAGSIVEHAAEMTSDLIVMCSHGKGAAQHLFLGMSLWTTILNISSHYRSQRKLPKHVTHHFTSQP